LFHTYVAYWLISCVLERRVFLAQGDQQILPNLYIVLLAPSSLYHKSTAIHSGVKILNAVKPDFLYPQEYSHEALIDVIKDKPAGSFFYDEISSLLELSKKDYAGGIMALLTTLYSGGIYRRKTGTKDITIQDPFVNIIGASTINWLKTSVRGQDIMGGFLPRFLFIPQTERTKILAFQPPADVMKRNHLVNELGKYLKVEGEAKYTPEAVAAYSKWYSEFIRNAEGQDEKLMPFLHRLVTYCHKLALILSVDRGEFPNITLQAHTEAKLRIGYIARLLDETIIQGLGLNQFQRDVLRAENLIKSRNSEGISNSDVLRALKISAKDWDGISRTLVESEKIKLEQVVGHGRPKTLIYWVGPHA